MTPKYDKRLTRKFYYKEQEKEARKIYKEYDEARDRVVYAKMIKLDKPRFIGWQRDFVLKDSYAKLPQANILNDILKKVNVTWYSEFKDFWLGDYTSYYSVKYRRKREYVQTVRTLYKKDMEDFTGQHRKYFYRFPIRNLFSDAPTVYSYDFVYPNAFTFSISKRYITEVKETNSEAMSTVAVLGHKLWSEHLWDKYLSNHYNPWGRYYKYRYEIRHKDKEELVLLRKQYVGA